MAGNRHGRDPFDDDRTEFIGRGEPTQRAWGSRDGVARGGAGRDDQPTEYIGGAGRGDQPTEFIGGAGAAAGRGYGPGENYDPDADFGGAQGRTGDFGETRQTGRPDQTGQTGRAGQTDSGQYWAPLTPEERGIDPREARDANAGAPYGDARYDDGARRDAHADRDPRAARDYRDDDDGGRRGGAGRSATIIGVTAIIAVVVLVALMFRFLSGGDDDNKTTATTPPPEPSTSSQTVTSEEPTTETSDPMRDELDRLRDEVSSLRETPPAIPGFGGGEAVQATVPEAVGKSPAEVELALRRAGFGNITILDAAGNPTNSLSSLTGRVATIDPPAGTAVMTDQPITITLE